jgi:hypothetical protein
MQAWIWVRALEQHTVRIQKHWRGHSVRCGKLILLYLCRHMQLPTQVSCPVLSVIKTRRSMKGIEKPNSTAPKLETKMTTQGTEGTSGTMPISHATSDTAIRRRNSAKTIQLCPILACRGRHPTDSNALSSAGTHLLLTGVLFKPQVYSHGNYAIRARYRAFCENRCNIDKPPPKNHRVTNH